MRIAHNFPVVSLRWYPGPLGLVFVFVPFGLSFFVIATRFFWFLGQLRIIQFSTHNLGVESILPRFHIYCFFDFLLYSKLLIGSFGCFSLFVTLLLLEFHVLWFGASFLFLWLGFKLCHIIVLVWNTLFLVEVLYQFLVWILALRTGFNSILSRLSFKIQILSVRDSVVWHR
jgi:hypothetical protein